MQEIVERERRCAPSSEPPRGVARATRRAKHARAGPKHARTGPKHARAGPKHSRAGPTRARARSPRVGAREIVLFAALAASACGDAVAVAQEPRARNVLLITLDTTRADRLGAYGYDRPTSPHLDRLAETALVAERAYSTSSWTLPAVTSVMTGRYAAAHGCFRDNHRLSPDLDTLAELLAARGFDTHAVVSHVYLDERYGLDQGFATYDTELVRATARDSHMAITSPAITEKGIEWLRARAAEPTATRWFLWLHYFDPHHHYVAHEGFASALGEREPSDRYDGEVAFTDAAIGRVLDALGTLGFGRDTVVVVVADHGEEFGEHGGHGHRRTLYEEAIRVPLLVRAPGLPARRIDAPVSLVDVLPTVLDLVGEPPPLGLPGRSLAEAPPSTDEGQPEDAEPRALLVELDERKVQLAAIVAGRWKLVHDRVARRSALYDLERDPREVRDLARRQPRRVRAMERTLQELSRAARASTAEHARAPAVELRAEDLRRLLELGYAGAGDED